MKKRNVVFKQREAWMRRMMKNEGSMSWVLPRSIELHEGRKLQKALSLP